MTQQQIDTLIQRSAHISAPIFVQNSEHRMRYIERAAKLGIQDMPTPVTPGDLKLPGVNPPAVLIEDVSDALLREMDRTYHVGYLTIDDPPVEQIQIKYHNPDLIPIERIKCGDWIDLRAAEDVKIPAGGFVLISLGVSMKLPDGYEAHVVPRSSTFKTWGLLQTNSMGVIDNSYSGTNDIWKFPAYATRDTEIHVNDRICQFRIVLKMPQVELITVDTLDDKCRGGFGSTGTN